MNLSKLAQLANVSVSTVSKAFSDSNEISEQTKELIFSVAKENNCFDKYYKPRYSKKVIAVICPEIIGIHYSQMATYLSNEISSHDGTMLISVSDFSKKKQDELIDYYTRFVHADGIIIIEPSDIIKNNTDIPIVQIGSDNDSKNVDCVNVVIDEAMKDALAHIKCKGLKHIGFIGETYAVPEYDFFTDGMSKNGLVADKKYVVISNKRFYDAGYYGMDELIRKKNVPEVVFAAYSHIAVGIMQRIKEEKLSVPEDISVICMDDIPCVPYSDLKLSSIKMHFDELCATALDILYQKIEKKYIRAKRCITVTREFDIGETIITTPRMSTTH